MTQSYDQISLRNSSIQNEGNPYPPHYFQHQHSDDEIDLKELFLALWAGKWLIIITTFIFAAGGVFYALSLPNIYKADVVLASSQNGGESSLSSMASQFGGLASLAGINIGGGGTDTKGLALATLQSRQFINSFIDSHQLLVPLMAAKEWDADTNQLIVDPDIYNEKTGQWVRPVDVGQSAEPTDWQAHKVFKNNILSVNEAKDTGLVTVSVSFYSPELAQQWATWLVEDLNAWLKQKSTEDTKRNISYLEAQLKKTDVSDMQTVFYQLIEEQTKTLMLAEVKEEFAFTTIDPAVVPEERAKPKRALICVLATLLGGMLGVAVVLIRFAFQKPTLANEELT